MIDARELRIGNLIYGVSDRIETIVKITDGGKITTYKANGIYENDIDDLSPIPLTPEILEKCGFKKIIADGGAVGYYEYYDNGKYETSVLSKWGITLMGIDSIHIKYLHQLQNLFYALCGKELEIKL